MSGGGKGAAGGGASGAVGCCNIDGGSLSGGAAVKTRGVGTIADSCGIVLAGIGISGMFRFSSSLSSAGCTFELDD